MVMFRAGSVPFREIAYTIDQPITSLALPDRFSLWGGKATTKKNGKIGLASRDYGRVIHERDTNTLS